MPSGSGCPPPAFLPLVVGRGLYAAGQLSFGICSILCHVSERVRLPVTAFRGKVLSLSLLSLFFSSLTIPQFGLLSKVISLRLSSGHSGWVLTLRTKDAAHASLSSPHSLVMDESVWATSPLAVAVRHLFCGAFPPPPSYVAL